MPKRPKPCPTFLPTLAYRFARRHRLVLRLDSLPMQHVESYRRALCLAHDAHKCGLRPNLSQISTDCGVNRKTLAKYWHQLPNDSKRDLACWTFPSSDGGRPPYLTETSIRAVRWVVYGLESLGYAVTLDDVSKNMRHFRSLQLALPIEHVAPPPARTVRRAIRALGLKNQWTGIGLGRQSRAKPGVLNHFFDLLCEVMEQNHFLDRDM